MVHMEDSQLEQLYRDIISTTPLPALWEEYSDREKDAYRHALHMAQEHTAALFVLRIRQVLKMEQWATVLDIIEAGIEGDTAKCKDYAELLLSKLDPDTRMAKRLQDILAGKPKGRVIHLAKGHDRPFPDTQEPA
jgi:hypothetical protein